MHGFRRRFVSQIRTVLLTITLTLHVFLSSINITFELKLAKCLQAFTERQQKKQSTT